MAYINDAERYARELTEAAQNGDWQRYRDIQVYLGAETVGQILAPYAPLVQKLQREAALDEAEKSTPGFRSFYGSEDYTRTLASRPKLKEAIDAAETIPQFQGDLPELYNIAYTLAASHQASTPQWSSQSARETDAGPDLSSSESRRRYIEELESRGIKDVNLDRADPGYGKVDR